MTVASVDQTTRSSSDGESSASKQSESKAGMGGGNLQMEQLHALVDVHLLAPAKTMTARDRLDAEFVEAEATQVASTAPAKSDDAPSPAPGAPTAADTAAPEQAKEQGQEQVAAQDQAEKPSDEPPMTGSCDRMWARVALKPKSESDKIASKQTERTKTASAKPGAGETNAEIRKVWMWGNVALHQDPKKDKDKSAGRSDKKGNDASGEALYLDNRGTNKAITYVYQRDPTEKTYLPGPLPPARVENNDIKNHGRGHYPDEPGDRPGLGLRARNTHATGRPGLPDRQSARRPMRKRTTTRRMATPILGRLRPTPRSRFAPRPWPRTMSRMNPRLPRTMRPTPSRRPAPACR